ncbi:MAG: hypothetical protein M9947_15125 [Thermomicrobiales bacterium]|nr:hypothetical protein [Thermomicrobiales bacterium]
MDGKHIDRLARYLAQSTNRRKAIQTMAAGSLGGAALSATGVTHVFAQDAPGEEWVQLYEDLAAVVGGITGTCDDVSDTVRQFEQDRAADIERMQAELAQFTSEQVKVHQEAYGERVQQATIAIHLAATRCGYLDGSDSAFSVADINAHAADATPAAAAAYDRTARSAAKISRLPVAQDDLCHPLQGEDYCECACDKNFTAGNCALWIMFCLGGGCHVVCCWSGICMGGFDHQLCVTQCMNCDSMPDGCPPPSGPDEVSGDDDDDSGDDSDGDDSDSS